MAELKKLKRVSETFKNEVKSQHGGTLATLATTKFINRKRNYKSWLWK